MLLVVISLVLRRVATNEIDYKCCLWWFDSYWGGLQLRKLITSDSGHVSPRLVSANGGGWGVAEMTIKTRNILWIVLLKPLVVSFNEGRQGLLERHVHLGWDGLGKMGEGGMGHLQERESFLRRKNNVWGGSPEPIEIFFILWMGFEGW